MSFYSVHLAWQQRVGHENRDHSANFKRVFSGKVNNKTEQSYNSMYNHLFSQNNPVLSKTYQPKRGSSVKQVDTMSSRSSQRANLKKSFENRPQSTNAGMRTYLPDEYFKKVGYQGLPQDISICAQGNGIVTGQIRTDALGQQVRARFNEELTYDEKVSTTSSRRLRLNKKLVHEIPDQRSNASSVFRVRSIQASSHARALSHISGASKPVAQAPADDLTIKKAQTIIEKVLGEDQIEEDPYRMQDQQALNDEAEQADNGDLEEVDKPSTASSQ